MKRPAIFFDRDNTLMVSEGYLGDPSKVVPVEGAADAVARARGLGYATVVFSNQSGVARGLFGEDAVRAVNGRLDQLLVEQDAEAIIDRHEFCPYHPQAQVEEYRRESDLRKPNPGMIYAAAHTLALDLSRSWVIGDAPRDIEAGVTAGCRTILFRAPNLPESPAAREAAKVEPEKVAASLKEALDYIESDPPRPPVVRIAATPDTPNRPSPPPLTSRSAGTHGVPGEGGASLAKLESLAEEILRELRRQALHAEPEFSITKLLGGMVQVVSIAIVFLAYLNRADTHALGGLLRFAIWLQCLTI